MITVTAGATEPRYPSLKGVMAAKSKQVERLTAADLGLSSETSPRPDGDRRDRRAAKRAARRRVRRAAPARIADLLAEAKVI